MQYYDVFIAVRVTYLPVFCSSSPTACPPPPWPPSCGISPFIWESPPAYMFFLKRAETFLFNCRHLMRVFDHTAWLISPQTRQSDLPLFFHNSTPSRHVRVFPTAALLYCKYTHTADLCSWLHLQRCTVSCQRELEAALSSICVSLSLTQWV